MIMNELKQKKGDLDTVLYFRPHWPGIRSKQSESFYRHLCLFVSLRHGRKLCAHRKMNLDACFDPKNLKSQIRHKEVSGEKVFVSCASFEWGQYLMAHLPPLSHLTECVVLFVGVCVFAVSAWLKSRRKLVTFLSSQRTKPGVLGTSLGEWNPTRIRNGNWPLHFLNLLPRLPLFFEKKKTSHQHF